jgi:hypothetical protein
MNRRINNFRIFKDDRGVALTEFCIVIPIILLCFFAMLQYFAVVQASQLGNYAAYEAARVYAVRAAVDPNDAYAKAQTAAERVLAPIARPVPGEPGYGLFNLPVLNLGPLSELLGQNAVYAANYAKGLAYVSLFRLQPNILGGSVNITTNGTPTQVNAAINYPQPVFIPGLAGIWDLVTGERIYHSLLPLSQGLNANSLPGVLLPFLSFYDQAQEQLAQFNYQLPSLPFIIYPYINVQSKCSMGCEAWSGTLRLRNNDTSLTGSLSPPGVSMGGLDDLGNKVMDMVFDGPLPALP